MKVFFDIITNHTADVNGYYSGARKRAQLSATLCVSRRI